jgi:hypothetical protein
MKFIQLKDGSCDILFTNGEIEILNKTKKFNLPPEAFKHTINEMMAVLLNWADTLPENFQNISSEGDQEVKIKDVIYNKKDGFTKI